MMRTVLLCCPRQSGGVMNVFRVVRGHLERAGFRVELVAGWWSLLGALRRHRGAPVICALGFSLLALVRRNVILTLHGFPCAEDGRLSAWTKNLIFRLSASRARTVVAVSELTRIVNRKVLGIRVDTVIPNPVEVVDVASGFRPGRRVVFVGRLVHAKRVREIAQAARTLLGEGWNGEVHFFGDGPLRTELEGSGSGFFLHGWRDLAEIVRHLGPSSVFISLNEFEPFGLTAFEAAQTGAVVCLPRYGGHAPYLLGYGRKVEVDNADEPAAVERALRAAVAEAAVQTVSASRWDASRHNAEVARRYAELVS